MKSYRAGTSIKALSQQFELHEQTVRAHLERADVELRPQQVLTTPQVKEIAEFYRAGASLRQLGLQYHVANNSIRNYLLWAGVELRAHPAVTTPGCGWLRSTVNQVPSHFVPAAGCPRRIGQRSFLLWDGRLMVMRKLGRSPEKLEPLEMFRRLDQPSRVRIGEGTRIDAVLTRARAALLSALGTASTVHGWRA